MASNSLIDWLLDSDPAIRWQVMRDLLNTSEKEFEAQRAKVATEGLGAQLLSLQGRDGSWGGTAWNHGWDSTMHVLTLLHEFGLDPASDEARHAMKLVRENVHWMGWDWDGSWKGQDFVGNPFFAGEVEPCINGQVMASGAYFGQDCSRILELLLKEQLSDGGWNCEVENGSTRSSFNTTICVLEALLEYELAGNNNSKVTEARLRGQDYLLERRLFRRLSTGEVIDSDWMQFSFPTWWHYEVLRGLEYLRKANVTPDERMVEAIELVKSKRDNDGRWSLENQHAGTMAIEMDEGEGKPSRWNTLRALRVLDWYSARE